MDYKYVQLFLSFFVLIGLTNADTYFDDAGYISNSDTWSDFVHDFPYPTCLATRGVTLQLIYPYIGSRDPQHLHRAFIGLNESSPQVMNNGEMYQTQKSIFLFHTLHS